MQTILSFIVVIVVLVVVHELGHFLVAKACGVYVKEFMVGLGPKVVEKQWGETLYTIRALPIGGAVQMLGEDGLEDNLGGEAESLSEQGVEIDPSRSFVNKPAWQRLAILFAGPGMNFLFAIIAFIIIFSTVGMPSDATVIGMVVEGSPAASSELKVGDKVLTINETPVDTWRQMSEEIKNSEGKAIEFTVERSLADSEQKTELSFAITPKFNSEVNKYTVGIGGTVEKSAAKAVPMAFANTYKISKEILLFIPKLISGAVDRNQIAGPIGIAKLSGEFAQQGALAFLSFMAYISINLGIMNLLPIPALDGGRILIILVELMIRRKLPAELEAKIHLVGFAFLMLLMILIVFSDITKLVS